MAFKSAVLLSFVFGVFSIVALVVEPWYGQQLSVWAANSTDAAEHRMPTKFANPLFSETWEFRYRRWPQLAFLTRQEAEFGRRMIFSMLLGALLGLERRESNRGAGVRTMSLVSLGACVFTLGGTYAFEQGTQEWDASRVSAALPSGVGFLGGALIFKDNGQIQGLTTACGVWLACAVGMCCGGGMYFVSAFGVVSMVAMLRFGPRYHTPPEEPAWHTPSSAAPLLAQDIAGLTSPTVSKRRMLQLSADE